MLPSLTTALVPRMSIESIPRIVFAASLSACCAASRHDSDETPTRSIVLMTAVPPPRSCRRGDRLAVLAAVDPLDLPDVGFDARSLQLLDRRLHQLGALVPVPCLVVAGSFHLLRRRRDEQLEQVLPPLLVQPVTQTLETLGLSSVHRVGFLPAVRVVADEHLGERGIELLDVRSKFLAVLEVELVLPALLDGHGQDQPGRLRVPRGVGAELLVDEHACGLAWNALVERPLRALVDHVLRVRDACGLLGVRLTGHTEELLLERASVVEREDVERLVVAERHSDS